MSENYYPENYYGNYEDDKYYQKTTEDTNKVNDVASEPKVEDKTSKDESSAFNVLYTEKNDIDDQLLENYNKIKEQIKIWKERGDNLNAFISEFNDTYVELFRMNHIHLKPYPLNNYSFKIEVRGDKEVELHDFKKGIFTHMKKKPEGDATAAPATPPAPAPAPAPAPPDQYLKILFGVTENTHITCEFGDNDDKKHAVDSLCRRDKNYDILIDGKWVKMPEHERIQTFLDGLSLKNIPLAIRDTLWPTLNFLQGVGLKGQQQYSRFLVDKSTLKKVAMGVAAISITSATSLSGYFQLFAVLALLKELYTNGKEELQRSVKKISSRYGEAEAFFCYMDKTTENNGDLLTKDKETLGPAPGDVPPVPPAPPSPLDFPRNFSNNFLICNTRIETSLFDPGDPSIKDCIICWSKTSSPPPPLILIKFLVFITFFSNSFLLGSNSDKILFHVSC